MSILRSIEERIARIVEGGFGRAFRTSVQPVEIARRLVREMDDGQRKTMRQVFVPNVYEVYLSPADHAQFEGHQRALLGELSEYLAQHAARRGYALATRPRVSLMVDEDLGLGSFGIAARLDEEAAAQARAADASPAGHTSIQPAVAAPVVAVAADAAVATSRDTHALLGGPAGPMRLTGPTMRLGRGRSNQLVVHDSSVSREHADLILDASGAWHIRDLDSTNGVMVNGLRVREQQLALGDRVRCGSVEFTFDRVDTEVTGA